MATLVGELARRAGCAAASAPREKSLCAIKPRSQVQVRRGFRGSDVFGKELGLGLNTTRAPLLRNLAAMGKPLFRCMGEFQGFVEEVRFQAIRLHAKDQAKEPVAKRGPSVEEYLKFLVDSNKVYETMEAIVTNSSHPSCESLFKLCHASMRLHIFWTCIHVCKMLCLSVKSICSRPWSKLHVEHYHIW